MSSDASLFVPPSSDPATPDTLFAPEREDRKRRRRRRARRIVGRVLLVFVALAALFVLALPAFLSSDLVRSSFVKRLNRAAPDSVVEIRDWTWRWSGPCRVDGISLRKRDQSVAFSLESVSTSKGLLAWLGFRQDFGVVVLDQPVLTVMELPEPVASAAAVSGPRAPRGAAAASPSVAPQAVPSTRRGIPFPLNPFGQIRVTNGRAEAFPREAPIVRVSRIEATATLAGLAGPVSVAASSSLPQSQGMNGATNAAISLSATLASLRSALADPTSVGVEATLDVPPVDLTAVEAFLPASPARPRIGSGRLNATLALRRGADASLELTGQVRTRGVRLSDGALAPDRLAWEEAGLTLSLQQRPGEIAIRELRLESPFVAAQASGSLRTDADGSVPGSALVAEGLVDLATLGAQLPSKLRLRPGVSIRRGVVRFDAEAATQATGLHVFALLRCDGVDAVRDGRPLRVELPITLGLNADLTSAGEPRHATLALKSTPVTITLEGGAAKGTAVGDADLGALHAALSPLLELGPEPPATGLLALRGGWREADGGVVVEGDLQATRLRVVRATAAPLELPTAKVAATALLPRRDGAVDSSRVQRLSVEASVPFATAKFAAAEVLPRQGVARGFAGSLDAELAPLLDAAGAGGGTPIAERLAASVSGDLDPDEVRMREFAVAAGAFDLKGSGALVGLTGERRLDVAATLGVDFDRLQPVVTQRVEGVVLSGRSAKPLQLSAPLGGGRAYLLSALRLDTGVAVERLAALGMVAREAVIDVSAADGQLAIRTSATVNEGRFQLAPAIDLLATPPVLTLPPKSRVLDDAQLTQEMLEQQLARIHPILRGCSVSSGRVSIDMADFALPVVSNAAQRMAWTAQFTLRDARLAAAGALADAADALRLRHREVLITNQTLVVACRNGRFYPQPLDLAIDGHALRVAGSVGLDGSLDYAVEIPLTEKLVGEEAYRYLRGQTVRIPVSGTAAKPRLDAAAIQSEIRRLVASVAARVAAEKLQDELRGQLKDRARDFDAGKLEDALRRLRP